MQTLAKRDTILDLLRLSLAGKSTIPYTADSSQEILQHISVVLQRRCYCAKYNRLSLTENYSATYMAVPPKQIQEFHRFATFVLALKWNAKVPVSMKKKITLMYVSTDFDSTISKPYSFLSSTGMVVEAMKAS